MDMYGLFSVKLDRYEPTLNTLNRRLEMTNVYFGGWSSSDTELYQTGSDRWRPPFSKSFTGIELQDYIKRLQADGFRILMYFRQFLRQIYSDRPPYDKWILRDEVGNVLSYVNNVQPAPDGSHLYADFCQEDFRQWYVQKVKECVDFYRPDGIAWDMGWFDIWTGYAPSQGIEGAGIHHGILRVQAEIYDWIQSQHPNMKVVMNLSGFSPSGLYADAASQEGGHIRLPEIGRASCRERV